jgi:hypothetical protein
MILPSSCDVYVNVVESYTLLEKVYSQIEARLKHHLFSSLPYLSTILTLQTNSRPCSSHAILRVGPRHQFVNNQTGNNPGQTQHRFSATAKAMDSDGAAK